jgi:hypothetical protein
MQLTSAHAHVSVRQHECRGRTDRNCQSNSKASTADERLQGAVSHSPIKLKHTRDWKRTHRQRHSDQKQHNLNSHTTNTHTHTAQSSSHSHAQLHASKQSVIKMRLLHARTLHYCRVSHPGYRWPPGHLSLTLQACTAPCSALTYTTHT